jgi:acyl-CoA hydrolase
MKPQVYYYHRLVKSEDLNHHRTLFAGRCAEWFVEAGFIAVASVLPPNNVVCLKIHGLTFTRPVHSGNIVRFESKIVETGNTSLKVFVALYLQSFDEAIVSGYITFIHVDNEGHAMPHSLSID